MTNSVLAKLAVQITANSTQFNKALADSSKQLNRFQSSVTDSVKGLAAGFGAVRVAEFALDVSKLAGEAEGVKRAFDKLPNSVKVMAELKDVTRGTVSELELMKRAVTATNFGISLEALPKLLEFATVRAQQTGQSVDYLVDSIVTGIGRKSPLILDNLGISTTRLKEKFGGAALEAQNIGDVAKAVGAIAEEELSKMGSMSENAATKIARLNAEWENLKVAIGGVANGTGVLGGSVDSIVLSMRSIPNLVRGLPTSDLLIFMNALISNPIAAIKSVNDLQTAYDKLNKAFEITSNKIPLGPEPAKAFSLIPPIVQELTQAEKDRLAEIKKINDERVKELSRLKELRDVIDKRTTLTGPAKFDAQNVTFTRNDDGSANAMAAAQQHLGEAIELANQKQREQIALINQSNASWLTFGQTAGAIISNAIAGNEDFLESTRKSAAGIIQANATQIASWLAVKFAKDSLTKTPAGAIAALTVGLSVVAGLLGKNWKRGGAGGITTSTPNYSRSSVSGGMQSVTVTGVIRGQDIYLSNQNYQRASGYTKG